MHYQHTTAMHVFVGQYARENSLLHLVTWGPKALCSYLSALTPNPTSRHANQHQQAYIGTVLRYALVVRTNVQS